MGANLPRDWVIFVCDLNGNKLADLSRVGTKRQMQFRLNRPAQFSFTAPSNHSAVVDASGAAVLKPGRIIKAWRGEGGSRVLRFAGYVWTCSDEGDEAAFRTSVVCFDSFQRLATRLCRDAANAVPADGKVSFAAVEAETIIRNLIDRTNTGGGVCGLRTVSAGPTSLARTVDFEYRKVADAILELCQATGINFYVLPEDRTDGYLGQIVLQGNLSSTSLKKLAWGAPPHNVRRIERVEDMQGFANDFREIGSQLSVPPRPSSLRSDATSITNYGRYEDVEVRSDITLQAFLDGLADRNIALRKVPRTLVKSVPQPDASALSGVSPWVDFDLGWQISVAAGKALRGGFTGTQRVWGWDLDIDDNAVERISAVYTGPDA